jgi:hypothetical protein
MSPRRRRVVRGSRKISAKIGVSDPGSIAQLFADMKDLDAVGSCRDETRFADSSRGTNRTEI